MIREATAMKVRQNLGEILAEVQYRRGKVLITKAGKPVAAIVDVDLFERLQKLDDEFDTLVSELTGTFAALEPEEGMTLIDEAVVAARESARE